MIDPHVLEDATRRLVERFHPRRIILLGSHARGTADARSDVDLLVICRFQGDRWDLALEPIPKTGATGSLPARALAAKPPVAPQGGYRDRLLAMDRALKGLRLARDIVILTPEEFERDRHIPGTVVRPAASEGKVLYDSAA